MFNISKNSRSLVNILGIPTIIFSIYSEFAFPIMVLILLYFCSIEYVHIVSVLGSKINKILFLLFNLLIFGNSIMMIMNIIDIFVLIFILVFLYEIIFNNNNPNVLNCAYFLMGVFWIGYCLSACLIYIRNFEYGMFLIFMLFISIWICDTLAFIIGSKYGKYKILPMISPKKTYIGCIAGLIGVIISLIIFNIYENYYIGINLNITDIFVLSIILGVISQLGDFSESLFKRQANLKDTAKTLMGHGGFLDRFDSISFATPLFYLYILYFIN